MKHSQDGLPGDRHPGSGPNPRPDARQDPQRSAGTHRPVPQVRPAPYLRPAPGVRPAPDMRPAGLPHPSRPSAAARRHGRRSSRLPLPLLVAIDVFLIGTGLILFSLFHHVLPRDVGLSGIVLPQSNVGDPGAETITGLSDPSGPAAALPGLTGPAGQDGPTVPATGPQPSVTTASGAPAVTGPASSVPAATSTRSPAATTTARLASGSFAQKFRDQFTTGAVEKTATSYRSANVSITMRTFGNGTLAYSVADVYVSDLKYFRTAFATGKYGRGLTATVLDMANRSKAVLAMSGDYYGIRDKGIVIRNGVLYRNSVFQDVLILNNDGSMETFTASGFDIGSVMRRGAWQGWSFGPMLLKDGKPMTSFNSAVTVANPRGAIGYYEPGHYCFVLVDGRQPGYSDGMTMSQLSQLFYSLGCKSAYNLDGGESAVLTFQGAVFNRPYHDGREISDIVYIADA